LKKRFSKILGVALSVGLLASLIVAAVPVMANVSQPAVAVDPNEISIEGEYTITFGITKELVAGKYIMVTLPDDTNIDNFYGATWVASTVYSLGTIVYPITYGADYSYECTTAGTSAAGEPAWPIVVGNTVADGTAVWTCRLASISIAATSGIGSADFSGKVPTVVPVVDTDDLTIQFDLPAGMNATEKIGVMATIQIVIDGVTNPTEPGDYALTVKTEEETTVVESASYSIDSPVVGGGVYIYNASNILVDTYGGKSALGAALTDGWFGKDDFIVEVGPGTYLLTAPITITGEGVTLRSSDGAAETEIDCNEAHGIVINNVDVTIDGFKINDASVGITINADGFTVKNCDIVDADGNGPGILISVNGTDATIMDNTFDDCAIAAIQFALGAPTDLDDVDITGNEISGGDADGILFSGGNQDVDVTGNTISANAGSGIVIEGAAVSSDIMIKGNTISENEEHGILVDATAIPTSIEISENTIADNETDGIRIDQSGALWGVTNRIIFNNFSGNTSDHLQSDSSDDVNAYFNWWDSAVEDDFSAKIEEAGSGDINYEPWLMAEFGTGISVGDVTTNASSLDAQDAVSVVVSGFEDDTAPAINAEIISVGKYAANPEEELEDALAFFDVFVKLETGIVMDEVTGKLKFYDSLADENTVAYFWTGDFWVECSDQLARSGLVWVTITEDSNPTLDELEGTAFALVATAGVPPVLTLTAPAPGSEMALSNVPFTWASVTDATSYVLLLTANADLSEPVIEATAAGTAYTYNEYTYSAGAIVGPLTDGTPYYWQVTALDASAKVLAISDVSVFIAKAPVAEGPAEITVEVPPAEITVEVPPVVVPPAEITVELPPTEVPPTPAYIWLIIGVGAVLLIAVIVLIVRTRRVV